MDLNQYLEIKEKKHLILDLDETIVHLKYPWEIYKRQLWKVMTEVAPEIMERHTISEHSHPVIVEVINQHGKKAVSKINEYTLEFELEHLDHIDIEANPQLIKFIKTNRKYNLYLWSSQMRETAERVLKNFDIHKNFLTVITRSDVEMIKPDPHGFELIYNKTSPKSDYLMIGDSDKDMGAAKNAGIDFFHENYFRRVHPAS